MITTDKGVIYVALGKDSFDEAAISAQSVKTHNPNLHITLFTDIQSTNPHIDQILVQSEEELKNITPYFKEVGRIDSSKLFFLGKTPYKKTLYLDTDTYVRKNIEELFDYLYVHDLLLTRASKCDWDKKLLIQEEDPNILNAGVICFGDSPAVKEFFKDCLSEYMVAFSRGAHEVTDQHILNNVLRSPKYVAYRRSIMVFCILPTAIYNATGRILTKLKREERFDDVKIIHSPYAGQLIPEIGEEALLELPWYTQWIKESVEQLKE